MLEGSSSQNSHDASIDDNEIYIDVVGGGNKKRECLWSWCIEQKV